MQGRFSRSLCRAAAGAALLSALLVLAPSATSASNVAVEQLNWVWYATATTESSGQALSVAPLSGGATQFTGKGPTTGHQDTMARMQGNSVEPIEFRSQPINQTLYLNLSAPISMVLYWKTSLTGPSYSYDQIAVRIELWVGTQRVAGADFSGPGTNPVPAGGYYSFSAGLTNSPIRTYPEVTSLPAGETLILKVFRLGGISDFSVGTLKPHQTYILARGYSVDPLAGALYLDGGQLVANPLAQSPQPSPAPEASAAVLLPLALAGARRRQAVKAVVAVMLVSGMAGCFGPGAEEDGGLKQAVQPSVSATSEVRDDLVRAGHGAIEGSIQDEIGLAVKSAHLSLPGTSLFTDADARGAFRFPNVTAGQYMLRVDSPGYPPLEKGIDVSAGSVLRLLITMAKVKSSNANLDRHLHDIWDGKDKMTLIDDEFLPTSTGAATSSDTYYCSTGYQGCQFTFYVPTGKVVPPGTTRVEVTLTVSSGSTDKEVALRANTGASTRDYMVRPSGQPFNVVIFPDEADKGHQKFSYWSFTGAVRMASGGAQYGAHGYPLHTTGGKLHVVVVAHKGVVPYEAPHKEPWGTQTRLQVIKNVAVSQSCFLPCSYPTDQYYGVWTPEAKKLVPAGTLELRGSLSWTTTSNLPRTFDWNLLYRTADVPRSAWRESLKPATLTANGTKFDVLIPVQAGEEDPFYAATSNWQFYLDDRSEPIGPTTYGANGLIAYGQTVTLNLYAHRDPTWKI